MSEMGLGTGLVLSLARMCSTCNGTTDDHEPNCPTGQLEALKLREPSIMCPKCDGAVGVNAADLYECRNCRRQFSASGVSDLKRPRKTVLVDPRLPDPVYVLIMHARGTGHFPHDIEVARLKKAIEQEEARRESEAG